MEPRHHKLLAEILLSVGVILCLIGLLLIYVLNMNLAGSVVLIIGAASALIAMPTFFLLMILTEAHEK